MAPRMGNIRVEGLATTNEELVKSLAREVGFSLVGIADPAPHERSTRVYERWLDEGNHGGMAYLERHRQQRRDPRTVLPEARSVICVAVNYYHEAEAGQRQMDGADGRGVFSVYVHHDDYHDVMERMLVDLEARLRGHFPDLVAGACVDTRPISDRAMALRAGIAWLGKNTNVISPEYGSWIFLGELLTNLDLRPDQPLESLCGQCTRCIDACPTGALDTPFTLDARRCISYLTIEHRGEIPSSMHEKIGLDVYGCDTCQSVCPFNEVARESVVFDRRNRSALVDMKLEELVDLSDERFRQLAQGSSIERCKPEGMRRNARIVQANAERAPIRQPAAGNRGGGKEAGFYSQGK